jgi:hypothetical protein
MRRPKRARGETPRSIRPEYLRKHKPQRVDIRRSTLPAPVLTWVAGTRWRLEKPYVFGMIQIPAGFIFDLASVPRMLWWLIAPFELSIVGPLLHDYLYRVDGAREGYTRKQVDELFERLMYLEGISGWRRRAAYRAVRVFGGGSWREA